MFHGTIYTSHQLGLVHTYICPLIQCLNVKHGACVCDISGIDPPDAEKEKMGILALQMKERDVPHSVCIIYIRCNHVVFHFVYTF